MIRTGRFQFIRVDLFINAIGKDKKKRPRFSSKNNSYIFSAYTDWRYSAFKLLQKYQNTNVNVIILNFHKKDHIIFICKIWPFYSQFKQQLHYHQSLTTRDQCSRTSPIFLAMLAMSGGLGVSLRRYQCRPDLQVWQHHLVLLIPSGFPSLACLW